MILSWAPEQTIGARAMSLALMYYYIPLAYPSDASPAFQSVYIAALHKIH